MEADYDEYPKTLPRDDFWGQVRRTINGRRVTNEELVVITSAIMEALQLNLDDYLLDLMCGNGALTARLFGSCRSIEGFDRSDYLIEVAKEFFEQHDRYVFVKSDVRSYLHNERNPKRFTKAICYGSMAYLAVAGVEEMLRELRTRFPKVTRLLLGNVPDKERATLFFGEHFDPKRLSDPTTAVGVWWSQQDLRDLAADCGWTATFSRMPENVFNARYRYDAILVVDC